MKMKRGWAVAVMVMVAMHTYGQNVYGGHGTVRVQVGSFREATNAQDYLTRLRSVYFNPVLEQHGSLYRVIVPVGAQEEVEAVVLQLGNAGFRDVWVRRVESATHSPAPFAQLEPVQIAQPVTQPTTTQTVQPAATLPEGMYIESSSYVTYTQGTGVTIFKQVRISQARIVAPPEHTATLITEEIERLGLQNVFVHEVDDGVMLSLENIHFYGNTYILRPGGREEIHRVAEILRLFPGRNFLVAGHTNLGSSWRTDEGRMRLSINRANTVAGYLIGLNIPADRITIRGYGATRMIADHTNPATQWRNMRAEITILND